MRNPYQRKSASNSQKVVVSAEDQYKQFISTIVNQAKLFALYDEGWALCATPTGQQAFAVWQSRSLSQLLIKDNWARYAIKEIDLIAFIEQVIPFIMENNTLLSIDLTPEGQNILVSGNKFLIDIKNYLYSLYIEQPALFQNNRLPLPRKIRIHH
ncbi:DUF2750 domain-containing protein [Acinetobacter sichuanensis]|uniref:DUF2750 domain-containing protein n=1 Tax=Acinetobacter sichuanensis TaxID=2136183 RepID=A0A371YS60_9GAMM|nr:MULTISPECIES: DUF2750 domain-containing protein [Acinetobacter]MDM1762856.1 DUF2750 domain-containing protein [Acinetobacter sp. 226-1]MDM1766335.1 DUF2750 domain-containing protein [Acinetobacter sp. 226-4]RFC84306.1 DUF2750 domain-containing protein [Acinetobacter sichuanensis]